MANSMPPPEAAAGLLSWTKSDKLKNMRICLIHPPNPHQAIFRGPNQVIVQHEFAPPLSLMYLKSYLGAFPEHEVRLLNAQVPHPPGEKEIRREMETFQPQLVGITVHSLDLYDSLQTAALVKTVDRSIHVTLGGPHLWVAPLETLLRPEVDSVVIGEGEITFAEMVNRLAQKQDLEGVPGVWFKRDGQVIRNPPRPVTKDLDRFPFPDRTDWDPRQHRVPFDHTSPAAVMITSRGCPFQCAYCCTQDKVYRQRSPENVVEEMLACREMGYQSINFYDDNFNLSEKRVLELCREIERQKVGLPWSCRGRVSPITEEMIARMAETGCVRIHFGAESANQTILDQVKKGISVEDSRRAFALARKHGISTLGYLMIGFPGETPAQAWKTIRFAFELDPDFAIFHTLVPAAGTAIYEQALQDPAFGGDYWKTFAENPWPHLQTRTWATAISEKQLFRMCQLAYLGFYFRPRYLFRSLRQVRSGEDFWVKARMALKILTGRY